MKDRDFSCDKMGACDRDRLNIFYPTGYPDRTENIHFLLSKSGSAWSNKKIV